MAAGAAPSAAEGNDLKDGSGIVPIMRFLPDVADLCVQLSDNLAPMRAVRCALEHRGYLEVLVRAVEEAARASAAAAPPSGAAPPSTEAPHRILCLGGLGATAVAASRGLALRGARAGAGEAAVVAVAPGGREDTAWQR
mmetsp:Transcript_34529/g.109297  ORF Transcript_34529/g.109297 Transcript_34529/m.109297 type:complete len:139 (-) Transcript_34529:136-552(-)